MGKGITPLAVGIGLAFAAAIGLGLIASRKRSVHPRPDRLPKRTAIVVLLIIAGGTFVVQGIHSPLVRDEGVFVVTNFEVANGNLPYVAAFDNTGPVGPWFGGAGVALGRLVGLDAVTSARLTYFPVALVAVAATVALGMRGRLSAVASAAGGMALMAIPSFSREALSGPRPKLLVLALLVLYLISLHDRRYALSGVLLALAILVWQSSFVLIVVPIAAAVWKGHPENLLHSAARFAGGGLVPMALVLAVYTAAGEMDALIEGFITWNLQIGSSRLPSSPLEAVIDPLKDLWGAHQATWPLLVVGGFAILPFSRRVFDVPRPVHSRRGPDAIDLITVAFVVLAAWTLIDYQGVVDLFPLFPLAAIGIARVAEHMRLRAKGWSAALLTVLVLAGGVDVARTHDTRLLQQRKDLEALVATGCVVSYGAPVALAIAGQSNPHRFFFEAPGLDEHLGPAGAMAYLDTLTSENPAFVGGPVNPPGPNLASVVSVVLPDRGYRATAGRWFEGWLLGDLATSQDGCP